MDGISATEAILREVPFPQIVILSVQSEPDYMRRAMLAGARDFMVKPPSSDELIGTIRNVAVLAQDLGKILAFYSAKGGVGCTTLATNMAIGLNTEDTPTVLVDANLQFGDVPVFLNMQVKNSIIDLAARAEEIDPDILEDVLLTHESGLHILAGPPRPEMADEIHADQVRKVLQLLRRHFAYVVVDTSSTMDDVTLAALDSADLLVSVATPDIPAIKDARLLFDLLHVLEFPTENVCFVINKMDRKGGISSEAISENLRRPVEAEIPLDERTVNASIN